MSNFDNCLALVLKHEGGYVNDPHDPGGATNQGITERVYHAHLRRLSRDPKPVQRITSDEVAAIYRRDYWDAARCGDLHAGVDYAVFDFAVNSGVARAARSLQAILGVAQDGVIGPVTLATAHARDPVDLITALCNARLKFCQSLKVFHRFGRGWARRIMGQKEGAQDDDTGVIDRASAMARGDRIQPVRIAAQHKADGPKKRSASAKDAARAPINWLAATGGIGSLGAFAGSNGPIAYAIAIAIVVAVAWFLWSKMRPGNGLA